MDTSNEELSNKRKRDIEDLGERDMKKVHTETSRLSIEDLHLDVGAKYLICRTRKTPFFPRDWHIPLHSTSMFFDHIPSTVVLRSIWLTWT